MANAKKEENVAEKAKKSNHKTSNSKKDSSNQVSSSKKVVKSSKTNTSSKDATTSTRNKNIQSSKQNSVSKTTGKKGSTNQKKTVKKVVNSKKTNGSSKSTTTSTKNKNIQSSKSSTPKSTSKKGSSKQVDVSKKKLVEASNRNLKSDLDYKDSNKDKSSLIDQPRKNLKSYISLIGSKINAFFTHFGKNRNLNKKTKHSQNSEKKEPIFTKKTKKIFLLVSLICGIIILLEGVIFLIYSIQNDQKNVYYDVLNAIDLDGQEIVAVGSSDFRYSKSQNYTKGYRKGKLIKYDSEGKIIFEKMYDNGINTNFNSVISVSDGYVVVGNGVFSEEEQENEASEAFIIKFDKEGNIIWQKFYQVVTYTTFNKVIETTDGYVAIGQSIYANMEMGNHTTGGGIIVKYDFNGNEIWHNNHGGMKSGNFNDIIEVDGNFYVVGKDATDSANLIKYDQNGNYQWHKNYSYTDGIGFTGITYLDHSLYVVGSKKVLPEGTGDDDDRTTTNTDALIIKYDLDGNIQYEKTFGGSNYERYNSILTYKNELYVIGHTTSSDAGFKVETDGNLMTGILVRYDQNGNILKKQTFGGSNNDNLTDIVTDGVSIYMCGYSNSKNGNITTSKNNGKDYFGKIIKVDFKFRTLIVK